LIPATKIKVIFNMAILEQQLQISWQFLFRLDRYIVLSKILSAVVQLTKSALFVIVVCLYNSMPACLIQNMKLIPCYI